MDKVQFEQEKQYGAVFAIAKRLHRCGLTTEKEHCRLTATIQQKYYPAVSLLPDGNPALNKARVEDKIMQKGGS